MSPGARTPALLEWARTLQALAQNGLTFSRDPFERERYTQPRPLGVARATERSAAEGQAVLRERLQRARPREQGGRARARAQECARRRLAGRPRALPPAPAAGGGARDRTDRG